jgi:protein gp37
VSDHSAIEWTDATWTPIRARIKPDALQIATAKGYTSLVQVLTARNGRGELRSPPGKVGPHCEHCSPGCEHCYSETNGARCLPANGTGLPFDRRSRDLVDIFVDEKILEQPLHWKRPRRVFVCSQTDLFGEFVPDEMIDQCFAIMALCPDHRFQVLTKRGMGMTKYAGESTPRASVGYRVSVNASNIGRRSIAAWSRHEWIDPAFQWPLPNVWLGVSVESREYLSRIDHLRRTPAAVRFLSLEPLLEDLGRLDLTGIHWVIVGGESGKGARPMHPGWVRSIQRQCAAARVPFFFKQWGAHQPISTTTGIQELPFGNYNVGSGFGFLRIGKKKSGRVLDSRTWDEMPVFAKGAGR